jgi:hypothetical protein
MGGWANAAMGLWVIGAPVPAATLAALAGTATSVRTVLDALRPWSSRGTQANFYGLLNTRRIRAQLARRRGHAAGGPAPIDDG